MLCLVPTVKGVADVSDDFGASIFLNALKMGALLSSETLVTVCLSTRRHVP
jgi:hypothetical protein